MAERRTIQVDMLARVEGEGALTLHYRGDTVEEVELRIFEPPRFFEAFLAGRRYTEAPDITARICGICPVAYQMSACQAMEDALGVEIPHELQQLRRMLYCGEWIESHTLHMVMLHAPDFLGFPDAMTMAREHGQQVRDGLRVKKAGNRIVSLLGGREIHPVNVRVGGFYKLPSPKDLRALAVELEACRGLAEGLVRWMAGFDFPALERDWPLVALAPSDGRYPFMAHPIGISDGTRLAARDWGAHFEEHHAPYTNALHARRRLDGRPYLCGPLARFALNFDALPAEHQRLALDLGLAPPVRNPFKSLLVRGVEVVFALDEAAEIARRWAGAEAPAVPVTPRAGTGHGATEAPRGLLYHRYVLDDEGLIVEADIVPPTSQNQLAIEDDLRALGPRLAALDDAPATLLAEQAIRNYDPCISCATHFLTLKRAQR
ncbi:MAG: Ni/Fe hydrogenase subunit alpha [Alphaproteobacteria bacterium]|nr:Ni/Fe hydrogenase subunit alpha [Alphaproteobacteria bacterium]